METFFLPLADGQRFCIFHPALAAPGVPPAGQIICVHAFAEEMNKCRRMVALQSRAFAAAGFDVLQIDLLGCGDSSGDFGDATWSAWIQDILGAHGWLRARAGAHSGGMAYPPLWIWGLRVGCLLASEAAAHIGEPCNFLFWAPTPSGKTALQQFLRIKAASDLASGNAKVVMEGLRTALAQGQAVEIGGYRVAAALATGLEHATLKPPSAAAAPSQLVWIDLSAREDGALSPVAATALTTWTDAGHHTRSLVVHGPAFWQTSEIEEAPELITATTAAVQEARQA